MNYFRPNIAPAGVRLAACTFTFDDADRDAAAAAYAAATACALDARTHVVAWRTPSLSGPWDGCAEVGDWRVARAA